MLKRLSNLSLSSFNFLVVLILFASLMTGLSEFAVASQTGDVDLTDAGYAEVEAYQSGDNVYMQLADADRNANALAVDSINVGITSDTEDTGTPASATAPAAGASNVGNGTMSAVTAGYSALTEDWTVTFTSSYSFNVEGSISGLQKLGSTDEGYFSDSSEVAFTILSGTTGFTTGDTFTFSTTAGVPVTEQVVLTDRDRH
jgi:hypothetical protein